MPEPTPATAARPLSRCLDCDAPIMSGAAEKPCPVTGLTHRWDHGKRAGTPLKPFDAIYLCVTAVFWGLFAYFMSQGEWGASVIGLFALAFTWQQVEPLYQKGKEIVHYTCPTCEGRGYVDKPVKVAVVQYEETT